MIFVDCNFVISVSALHAETLKVFSLRASLDQKINFLAVLLRYEYNANMSLHVLRISMVVKLTIFSSNLCVWVGGGGLCVYVFSYIAQDSDCGFTLEPTQRVPTTYVLEQKKKERKKMYTPEDLTFTLWKWGVRGVYITRTC